MSEKSAHIGRYLSAFYIDADYQYEVDIGYYRYFNGFNNVYNRYVHVRIYTSPPGPPTLLWEVSRYYGPDEDFGFNFNFGKNPSFEGIVNNSPLSIVFSAETEMESFKWNSPLSPYEWFIQQHQEGSARVMYSGWSFGSAPVDGWSASLSQHLAVVYNDSL